jgi:hypothetical protein
MPGPFYFAWTSASQVWDVSVLREDEQILSVELTESEGKFASLKIEIVNPRVGLLGPSRNLWCWLSWEPNEPGFPIAQPIFHGRLVGVPEQLQGETITIEFVARPDDLQFQKEALASTMRVSPYYDPVWLDERIDDPDTVLEARPALWHCDRVSHDFTFTDIINGEAGTIDVQENEHFYDDVDLSFSEVPLRRVNVTATVTWDQTGEGEVDLTQSMVTAFQDAGSPLPSPLICSLTGDGLFSDWPKALSNIGGGWSTAAGNSIVKATWLKPAYYNKEFTAQDPVPLPTFDEDTGKWTRPLTAVIHPTFTTWAYTAPVHVYSIKFGVAYKASRKRSEVVTFTLEADIQSLFTDAGEDEELRLEFSSDTISDPIDPGDATPLDDPGRNSYFKTPRGAQSFEYLVSVARTRMLSRARAVKLKFVTSWEIAIGLNCKWNVRLFDARLPGMAATGKVINILYKYSIDGISAEVTIGCTIGHGTTVGATATGVPVYVATGYFNPAEVQIWLGTTVSIIPGDITYLDFSNNFPDIDNDDIDFTNMTPETILKDVNQSAVSLTTNADVHTSTSLDNLSSTTGLVVDDVYDITGHGIQAHTTFTYTGSSAGTLSLAGTVEAPGVVVTITREAISSNGITITNGPADQAAALDQATSNSPPDPVETLKANVTRICLDLIPVDGGPFQTEYAQVVSDLGVPQTINLEA